ncbi:MAG: type II toxin-antitoxin system RelE/ParE family toxin [Thermomonas sp.]|uniref:type II toxin-antitoxin system RelE/ParE family toxin n=1 Tax=Thermomonas sp. TaxID=1971895 RepID=UPI001EC26948|nr:type II toxin-antitoxin system RelE/ParE family toxin [Thermomonas sp.]MBV2209924.1 type II toxin-antitoxin system RelE/ParE family toxin [Thermomonas sp.]
MAVILLPDAQADLLSLQDYMLDKWGEAAWLKAEDEIFEKLENVDAGIFTGTTVQTLAAVGILDYRNVHTSHHKLVYRQIGDDTFVYLFTGHKQDFPTLLVKRLLSR